MYISSAILKKLPWISFDIITIIKKIALFYYVYKIGLWSITILFWKCAFKQILRIKRLISGLVINICMQLYIRIENHSNMDNLSAVVENCVHKIKMWMQYNMLKLNDDKTELVPENMLVHFLDKNLHLVIQLSRLDSRSEILVSSFARLCQCSKVNTTEKYCLYYLRCIGRIRKYLSLCKTFSLNYGNVLLLGLPRWCFATGAELCR